VTLGTPNGALRSATCADSRECAARLGYGTGCDEGRCQADVDPTDLMDLFKKGKKEAPLPEPFKLLPAVIPAVGYNPALGAGEAY
jgi:hypothetical protein